MTFYMWTREVKTTLGWKTNIFFSNLNSSICHCLRRDTVIRNVLFYGGERETPQPGESPVFRNRSVPRTAITRLGDIVALRCFVMPFRTAGIKISRRDITRRRMRIASRAWPVEEENGKARSLCSLAAKLLVDIHGSTCHLLCRAGCLGGSCGACNTRTRHTRSTRSIAGRREPQESSVGRLPGSEDPEKSAALFRIRDSDTGLFRGQLLSRSCAERRNNAAGIPERNYR